MIYTSFCCIRLLYFIWKYTEYRLMTLDGLHGSLTLLRSSSWLRSLLSQFYSTIKTSSKLSLLFKPDDCHRKDLIIFTIRCRTCSRKRYGDKVFFVTFKGCWFLRSFQPIQHPFPQCNDVSENQSLSRP